LPGPPVAADPGRVLFHVTSVANRESILTHGLDWSRMRDARGIAGSRQPELDGVFVCLDEFEVDWFVRMNNTGGPVDVWAVDGVGDDEIVESSTGHYYVARPIAATQVRLVRTDLPPDDTARHV
jgi:hypothetical protein